MLFFQNETYSFMDDLTTYLGVYITITMTFIKHYKEIEIKLTQTVAFIIVVINMYSIYNFEVCKQFGLLATIALFNRYIWSVSMIYQISV